MLCNFSFRMLKYCIKIFEFFFVHKKLKKPPQKVAYLWQLGDFFSLPKTAQNFISCLNFSIQPSLLESLIELIHEKLIKSLTVFCVVDEAKLVMLQKQF